LNSSQLRRVVLYALILIFASISIYAYTIVPTSTTVEGQVESIFLLSSGLGGAVAFFYSLASSLSFLSKVSKDILAFDVRIPVSIISVSFGLALFYAYHRTGIGLLFIPVPALATFTILALRGIYPFQGRTNTPSIVPLTEDGLVKFVTSKDRLKKLAE